jgi:hypothetical protein
MVVQPASGSVVKKRRLARLQGGMDEEAGGMDAEAQARVWPLLVHPPPWRAAPTASLASRPPTYLRVSTPGRAARRPMRGSSVAEAKSGTTMTARRRLMGRKGGTQRRWWGSMPEHPRPSSTPSPPCVVGAGSSSLADPPCQLHHLAGSPASGRDNSPSRGRGRPRTVADGGDKQRARLVGASRAVPA